MELEGSLLHKNPSSVHVLSQINPVQTLIALLKINCNIILPSMSPSLIFPHQSSVHLSTPPLHATCPTRLLRDA